MLESLYQISEGRLDSGKNDHINSSVNSGTSAPNCQPSHTLQEIEEERARLQKEKEEAELREAERLAGLMGVEDSQHIAYLEAQRRRGSLPQERSDSGLSSSSQQSQPEKGSIGSYVQMAKTGYQELVNAIIR